MVELYKGHMTWESIQPVLTTTRPGSVQAPKKENRNALLGLLYLNLRAFEFHVCTLLLLLDNLSPH